MNTVARFFCLLSLIVATCAGAQTYDMTMDVLVNSGNATGYNPSATSPGEYQRYPERYLEHLQIPYRVIDTATQGPPANLGSAQLILAAHNGLNLSLAWQQAILAAVEGGTGFVNLDSDVGIGTNAHIQGIFGATGAAAGASVTSITVPSAVIPGGASQHYIAALQLRFPSTPAGDLVYAFHQDANGANNSMTPTVLMGASGTVIAKAGANPLILATQTAGGRAVDFASYDFMRPDRFGFMMGVDDLFWRSLVWAARKPFVLRGYPHFFALQLDDEVADFPTRFADLWNTSYTGALHSDGTGGPWKMTAMAQFVNIDAGGGDRTAAIAEMNAGRFKMAFHTVDGASEGDLYWNPDSGTPLTDAQWKANLAVALGVMKGNGGADTLPPLSKSMNPHFWNLSNNVGYDMWNSFGTRYITEIQEPGAYFNAAPPKTDAQRIGGRPFRLYELPPSYGEPNDIWPIYTADDLVVGSTAGLPPVTFFSFCTQLLGYTFPTFDAKWPSDADGYSVSYSVDNFEEYAWRFWSGQAPVQVYSHDGGNYERSTEPEREQAITQISGFLNGHGVRHVFMEDMGGYMRARVKSVLATATASPSTLTLNFTGGALDADGNPVATYFYTYYGDDEGLLQQAPGFSSGYTLTAANSAPPRLSLSPAQLQFSGTPGGAAQSQTVSLANTGGGTLPFTAQTGAAWLSAAPGSGSAPSTVTITADPSGLSAGTYTSTVSIASATAVNSPQMVPVSFTVSAPSLSVSPLALAFGGAYGGANPPAQSVSIANAGGGTVHWTAQTSAAWLQTVAASGTAPSTLAISVNTAGLAAGTYSGTVTITAAGSLNSPQKIAVSLTVSNTLLASNFASGTLDGWAYSPLGLAGNWSVANGTLAYNGAGATQLYAGNGNWSDYTVQTGFLLSSLSDYPGGLRARVNPGSGAAYVAWVYPAEGVIKLLRSTAWSIDAGGLAVLGTSGALAMDSTSWHTLAISVQGSTIAALYDGKTVVSATDATLATGLVALDVSSKPIKFHNVLVSANYANTTPLAVAPTSLAFSVAAGSGSSSQMLAPSTSDGSVAAYSVLGSAPWLSAIPPTGNTPGTALIAVNAGALAAGTYAATVRISSFGASNGTVNVPVTVTVNGSAPEQQSESPASLSFAGNAGGAAPTSQSLSIAAAPASAAYSVSSDSAWLTVTNASGSTPATLAVAANPGALSAGTHKGNLTVSVPSAQNTTVVIPVTFTVSAAAATDTLKFTPASLSFVGSTTTAAPAQSVALASTPTAAVAWQGRFTGSWLTPSTLSGTTPTSLQVGAATAGLAAGAYTDTLTVTPSPASGALPLRVPVALRVGTLLFNDTFADHSRWTASPQGLAANWSVVNNTFRYSGGSKNTQQYAGSSAWGNYTLQADMTLSTASNYPGGVRFRLNTSTGAGYAFWLYPGSNKAVFFKVPQWNIDASNTTLATATGVTLAAGTHHIRIDVQGSSFTAYLDNVLLLTATDTTYAAGAIALDVSNQVVSFSNVSVIQ